MRDLALRLVWFFVSVGVFSYGIFLMIGSTIHARALDESRIVSMRDALTPGAHHLSGMVMVPRTCTQLMVNSEAISPSTQKLVFTTWDVPSVPCTDEQVPRAFRTVVFAPAAGIHYIATLDGEPLTLVVHQEIAP